SDVCSSDLAVHSFGFLTFHQRFLELWMKRGDALLRIKFNFKSSRVPHFPASSFTHGCVQIQPPVSAVLDQRLLKLMAFDLHPDGNLPFIFSRLHIDRIQHLSGYKDKRIDADGLYYCGKLLHPNLLKTVQNHLPDLDGFLKVVKSMSHDPPSRYLHQELTVVVFIGEKGVERDAHSLSFLFYLLVADRDDLLADCFIHGLLFAFVSGISRLCGHLLARPFSDTLCASSGGLCL